MAYIHQGRVLLGNHLTEHSLVIYFTKAEAHYSTTGVSPCSLIQRMHSVMMSLPVQGSTPYDELMHVVDFFGENIRLVAEKSHGYEGPTSQEKLVL